MKKTEKECIKHAKEVIASGRARKAVRECPNGLCKFPYLLVSLSGGSIWCILCGLMLPADSVFFNTKKRKLVKF